ncbi:phosphotriesterase-related protein [Rhodococcus sp. SMB37]|uniref:phosphotriesterase family protein n=1 Tax=Rhodococcus sp. SMB37 TaxID=2512213 RepID=UPI00104A3014|nr:phosphotriesterase [Rhodococcus sp. SMB37]TCN50435.1 phosphotriesterase-related protein [Rhodococcus sp. SMB37]
MSGAPTPIDTPTATVHTVLGPVPADQLGATSIHEAILSVLPGAQYAFDITLDRAEIFDTLEVKLNAFKAAGGGTLVDATGQFHGRDLRLLEALSRTTGVHIVASTGQGPESMLGGYFLTPQTNPPTPWPAEKWAALFAAEVSEGMVVPRHERRGAAGLIATAVTRDGATATDTELLRGAARAAQQTGVAVSFLFGSDALGELEVVLAEGLAADRIVVGGVDRTGTDGLAQKLAERGAYIAIDHIGTEGHHEGNLGDAEYLTDAERVALVAELATTGHADKVLLSSSATGAAFGHPATDVAFAHVLSSFVPALTAAGVDDDTVRQIVVTNPAALLAVR